MNALYQFRDLVVLTLWLLLAACSKNVYETERSSFLDGSQTQTKAGVTVTVAVPSASETLELFGVSLYQRKIQPVWLDITNNRREAISFVPVGLDPRYFTPIESASLGSGIEDRSQRKLFLEKSIGLNIAPGENRSGFMFTQLDEGTKAFNVDILFQDLEVLLDFTFFVPVPGLWLDHQTVPWDYLYSKEEIKDLDTKTLIQTLESLPCCTTDKKARDPGDPLNLVVIGEIDDVFYAFLRAGWDETEVINTKSVTKMVGSFIRNDENRYSPVSGLYVFGRPQEIALQKARSNIHERNHLRLWLSPYTYQGIPVWLGQISRDIGIRFTKRTLTTHKIDPDVDETREYLLENLAYSQSLAKFGYVGGVGVAPFEAPRSNLTGDPYFTDGLRVVLWISSQPVGIPDIEPLDWGPTPAD